MAAYVIVDVTTHDHELILEYRKLVLPTLEAFGGRFLVRGGKTTTLEGNWDPERIVVLEFPAADNAKTWWHSEEYAEAKALRQRAATTKMIIVEGV